MEAAGAYNIVGIAEVGGFLLAEAAVGSEEARNFLSRLSQRGAARTDAAASRAASTQHASSAPLHGPAR
jgi:hypothetical protein